LEKNLATCIDFLETFQDNNKISIKLAP